MRYHGELSVTRGVSRALNKESTHYKGLPASVAILRTCSTIQREATPVLADQTFFMCVHTTKMCCQSVEPDHYFSYELCPKKVERTNHELPPFKEMRNFAYLCWITSHCGSCDYEIPATRFERKEVWYLLRTLLSIFELEVGCKYLRVEFGLPNTFMPWGLDTRIEGAIVDAFLGISRQIGRKVMVRRSRMRESCRAYEIRHPGTKFVIDKINGNRLRPLWNMTILLTHNFQ